jgi:hypothetical protein
MSVMRRRDPGPSSDGDEVSAGLPMVEIPEAKQSSAEEDDEDDDTLAELKEKKKRLRLEVERLQLAVNKAEAELKLPAGFNEDRWKDLLVRIILISTAFV